MRAKNMHLECASDHADLRDRDIGPALGFFLQRSACMDSEGALGVGGFECFSSPSLVMGPVCGILHDPDHCRDCAERDSVSFQEGEEVKSVALLPYLLGDVCLPVIRLRDVYRYSWVGGVSG